MVVKENYTKPLRKLLKEGGMWMNFSKEKYGIYKTAFQIIRYLFCVGVWMLTVCSLFQKGVQFLFTPPAIFIPLGGVLVSSTFIIFMQTRKLEQVIDQCEINLSSYKRKWEKDLVKSYCDRLEVFINFGKLGFINFALIYVFLPLIIDGIRIILGYHNPYYLPLPLEGYLDKNGTRNAFYYLIIITCDIWFIEAITLTNALEGLILFIVAYTIIELKIMKMCIEMLNIEPTNNDGVSLLPSWNLKRIVKYHRKLLRLNTLQNKSMVSPYITQNLTATLSLAFMSYMIRQLVGENTMMLLLSITFIIMIVVLLFIVCFAGEFIQTASQDLFTSIYNIPWYRQTPKVRRHVLLLMTQLSKPLVLDYKNNVLNLPAFMQMMNNSYSFFMLITSVNPT